MGLEHLAKIFSKCDGHSVPMVISPLLIVEVTFPWMNSFGANMGTGGLLGDLCGGSLLVAGLFII